MDPLLPFIFGLVRGTNPDIAERLWSGDGGRLRCPRCGWQPGKADRWSCNPNGCGHVWNTFDTGGFCPRCNRHWKDTACLRCGEWSAHEDWYQGDH